ncbi:AraC family transcriptional regulator [Tenacibaculum xiamenense]|uniref:AraC family transcriptional regulator n=1 Tax=Tenacibaculum xiamenense TaxID=1261553 RepID=UPI003892F747
MKYVDIKSNKERLIIDLLSMGFRNVVLLGHYSYKEAKEKLEMHKHTDMLEICFLETGSQYYQVGDEHYLLRGGDLLITPPNTIHGTSGYPEEKGSLFWMIIKVPKSSFRLLNLTSKESSLLIDRLLGLDLKHFKGSSEIKKILNMIFKAYNKKNDFLNKIEINNHILSFLLKVIYYGEKKRYKDISNDIEFCCKYIEENIFEKIYISNLAKNINLSESRFKHKFKEELGIPPNEYIIKQKISKAKELIEKDDFSIVDIAYDLGFSNSSYFSTVFKKQVGMSPSMYKQSLQSALK